MRTALLSLLVAAAPPALPELHRAAQEGDVAGLQALLDGGAEVNAPGPRDWTALHFACLSGKDAAVRLLLERGADANARGQLDMTPLHWVALQGHAALVPVLAGRGARVNARNLYGLTPLMLSADDAVVDALVAAGADLRAVDDQGMSALHLARSREVGKTLLDRGADLNVRSRDGTSLLEMAVVNELLAHGLLFYGRRAAGRLPGERAKAELTVVNVSSAELTGLSFQARSEACEVTTQPSSVATLAPGQRTTLALILARREGVYEGEYPLMVTAAAGGARLGEFEFITVDNSRGWTPEDRGMVRLGKVNLKSPTSQAWYGVFALVPLLVVAGWFWRNRR